MFNPVTIIKKAMEKPTNLYTDFNPEIADKKFQQGMQQPSMTLPNGQVITQEQLNFILQQFIR